MTGIFIFCFRLFERGIQHFKVILGDSNLNIDLPFGVQSHDISQVIIHENFKPEDAFHFDDIGNFRSVTIWAARKKCFSFFRQGPAEFIF